MRLYELFEYKNSNNDEDLRKVFDRLKPEYLELVKQYGPTKALDHLVHNNPRDRHTITLLTMDFKDLEEMDEGIAWARSGNKVVKKFRCSGGPRHGRVVSKPTQCFAPPDLKKRMKLKQTKAAKGKKMARKRKRTMRTNAASKRVQALNKR